MLKKKYAHFYLYIDFLYTYFTLKESNEWGIVGKVGLLPTQELFRKHCRKSFFFYHTSFLKCAYFYLLIDFLCVFFHLKNQTSGELERENLFSCPPRTVWETLLGTC